MNNRYLVRAGKYFVRLVLLVAVLCGILIVTGYTSWETLQAVRRTDRVYLLLGAFIVFPLMYPFFGFVRREVRGSLDGNREVIVKLLEVNGYRLVSDSPERMVFRANPAKRAMLFGEDAVTIAAEPGYITLEGPRREVVKVEFRMNTFL